jgi:hypothetical protein
MSSARFLVVILLLPLAAFAQSQQAVPYTGPPIPPVDCARLDLFAGTMLPLPLDSQKALLKPKTSINRFEQSPSRSQNFIPNDDTKEQLEDLTEWCNSLPSSGPNLRATRVLSKREVEQLMNGHTCYSIRSYLMARDSKDSDSTHLVSTSTCQPAQHYALKTTDLKPLALQP